MNTVTSNIKNSKIGKVLGGAIGAVLDMVSSVDEENVDSLNNAIEETIAENPSEKTRLNAFGEIASISYKILDSKANELEKMDVGDSIKPKSKDSIVEKVDIVQSAVQTASKATSRESNEGIEKELED